MKMKLIILLALVSLTLQFRSSASLDYSDYYSQLEEFKNSKNLQDYHKAISLYHKVKGYYDYKKKVNRTMDEKKSVINAHVAAAEALDYLKNNPPEKGQIEWYSHPKFSLENEINQAFMALGSRLYGDVIKRREDRYDELITLIKDLADQRLSKNCSEKLLNSIKGFENRYKAYYGETIKEAMKK